jgi:hypothetical protein
VAFRDVATIELDLLAASRASRPPRAPLADPARLSKAHEP